MFRKRTGIKSAVRIALTALMVPCFFHVAYGDGFSGGVDDLLFSQSKSNSPTLGSGRSLFGAKPPGLAGDSNPQKKSEGELSRSEQAFRDEMAVEIRKEPDSLFQDFIKKTTGLDLDIYGHSIFRRSNPFGEVQSTPVPSEYVLGPGDEIILKVYGGTIDSDQRLLVDRQGTILLPKVGPVSVSGVRFGQLESLLKSKIGKVLSNFHVFVTMGQLRGIEIYVVGQARRPGKYIVSSLSSVINALFSTGGPNKNGSLRAVQLVRDSKVVATVDLYAFLSKGDVSNDKRLLPGDVINIPPVGPMVAVIGAVPNPGIFELGHGSKTTEMNDLLPLIGGLPIQTSTLMFSLERVETDKSKPFFVQTLALNAENLKTPLKDGDILKFYPLKPAFENAVTLRIMEEDPVRVPIGKDAHVKDVIPTKETLLTNEYYLRQMTSKLRETFRNTRPNTREFDSRSWNDSENSGNMGSSGSLKSNSPEFSNRDRVENGPSMGQDNNGSTSKRDSGKYRSAKNGSKNGLEDEEDGPKKDDSARIRKRNRLDQINWEQAVIERINPQDFSLQLISFNLGKAILGNDPKDNIPLQPGDTITISGQNDIQIPIEHRTRIVRIHGEVKSPGIYQIQVGDTLTTILEKAGGLTANAYPYGTELSRQSVKTRQRENMQIVIRQLEAQLSSQSASAQAGVAGGADPAQVAAFSEKNSQSMRLRIDRMRELDPNGRISLEMDPSEPKLPAVILEDGDEILIPATPGYVSAMGAVYNDNVLIYHRDRNVSDYLKVAGVSDSAEEDNTFVLRADGSIVAPSSRNVHGLVLYPGDTIIVPEKFYKESGYSVFMRGLKDWTQVLFQLGLSAAVVHNLK